MRAVKTNEPLRRTVQRRHQAVLCHVREAAEHVEYVVSMRGEYQVPGQRRLPRSAVSGSRISPTMILAGSWRTVSAQPARGNVRPFSLTSHGTETVIRRSRS
jgi:hypothetical protein